MPGKGASLSFSSINTASFYFWEPLPSTPTSLVFYLRWRSLWLKRL